MEMHGLGVRGDSGEAMHGGCSNVAPGSRLNLCRGMLFRVCQKGEGGEHAALRHRFMGAGVFQFHSMGFRRTSTVGRPVGAVLRKGD